MRQIDLEGFKKWAMHRGLFDERHASYYLRWVGQYLRTARQAEGLSDEDRVLVFMDALGRDARVQDWQKEQARRAVELYVKGLSKESVAGEQPLGTMGDSEVALQKAVALIRLRHYSYRTETTYRDWLRRYFAYCGEHGLPWMDSGSARAFLSHLAMARDVASSTQNQAFAAVRFLWTRCDAAAVVRERG